MTTTICLIIHDGHRAAERRFLKFPVRLGRGPENDCSIFDPEASRSHATLDVEDGELILRDLGSQNGTRYAAGDRVRRLRGGVVRFPERRAELVIGRVRITALLDEWAPLASELPSTLPPALRGAANAILRSCEPSRGHVSEDAGTTSERLHEVLDACFANFLSVRLAIHGAESHGIDGGLCLARDETAAALLHWTQAAILALRVLEHGVRALEGHHDRLATDASETVDTLLRELEPERLERETSDVCTEWPAARASAVWARYRTKHQKLLARHQRQPSLLLGHRLGQIVEARRGRTDRRAVTEPAPASERRPKRELDTTADGTTDLADAPPSSQ